MHAVLGLEREKYSPEERTEEDVTRRGKEFTTITPPPLPSCQPPLLPRVGRPSPPPPPPLAWMGMRIQGSVGHRE